MNEAEIQVLIQPMIEGNTITDIEDFGDAFAIYFVNNEYFLSKKTEDLKIGAGPIIYIKNTGEIFHTGSGQTAEHYIQAYRECGDIYAKPSETIVIELPDPNEKKDKIINLRSTLGVGVAEAKALIEQIMKEGKITVDLKSDLDAQEAKDKLIQFGFKVKQLWRNPYV